MSICLGARCLYSVIMKTRRAFLPSSPVNFPAQKMENPNPERDLNLRRSVSRWHHSFKLTAVCVSLDFWIIAGTKPKPNPVFEGARLCRARVLNAQMRLQTHLFSGTSDLHLLSLCRCSQPILDHSHASNAIRTCAADSRGEKGIGCINLAPPPPISHRPPHVPPRAKLASDF